MYATKTPTAHHEAGSERLVAFSSVSSTQHLSARANDRSEAAVIPRNTFSLTAWVIVACHLMLARSKRWGTLVAAGNMAFYERCNAYCEQYFFVCRLLNLLPDAFKLWLVERILAAGAPQHYLLRKKAIHQQVQSSLQHGVKQVVVLGGGFDLLAFNIASAYPDVACFELDTPEMNMHKVQILRSAYGKIPANFYAYGANMSERSLKSIIAGFSGFDTSLPTLFVAEGLTMYLRESDMQALLSDVREVCRQPVSVLFTAIETKGNHAAGFGKLVCDVILGSNNETLTWSIERRHMPKFLLNSGFAQQYLLSYSDLQRPLRSEEEMKVLDRQNGEYVVYATGNPSGA